MNSNWDWVTYTPEGFVSGSKDGIDKLVHFVSGMEIIDANQMYDFIYRPDIIAQTFSSSGKSASENSPVTFSDIIDTGKAPEVFFENSSAIPKSRDMTVYFTVQDRGGGIGNVYLSINGKIIQIAEGTRKLQFISADTGIQSKAGGKVVQYSHTITLQNGDNIIEAYATNAAKKIDSRHASAKLYWEGATGKPSLYVLSVGINKYRDRSLWLEYSVPDAKSVAQSFSSQKTSLYQNIHTFELLDGDVTKQNLSKKFKEISYLVHPDDIFVLFIAGHGTTSKKTGDYYFIPSNFLYTDSDAIIAQGISKNDIMGYMQDIRAGKTLIMLDTCNSGAFSNNSQTRGFDEKEAIKRLVHATGQAVLMASSETQTAMEGYNGHGIFTYILLEALNGKADINKDGYTTISELASYIEYEVPERSYEKWGYSQVPMKELHKQDFPLIGK